MMYFPSLYKERRGRIVRALLSVCAFLTSLLVLPIPTLVCAGASILLFGGYETLIAGLLLDALLAPQEGPLGSYHYTVLFLGMTVVSMWLRPRMRLLQDSL